MKKPKQSTPAKSTAKRDRKFVAKYIYRDEKGDPLFKVVRYDDKSFGQYRYTDTKEWKPGVEGVRKVPYCLHAISKFPKRMIVICEGEKDCETLHRLLVIATTNAGGAKNWTDELSQYLMGRVVVILLDNDKPGRERGQAIARSLQGIARSVRVIVLPGLGRGEDVSDWVARGGTKDQLAQIIKEAPEWTVENPAIADHSPLESLPDEPAKPEEGDKTTPEQAGKTRPKVVVNENENDVNDRVVGHLSKDPEIYNRGGSLVRIARIDGRPVIQPLPQSSLRERITSCCYLVKQSESETGMSEYQVHPPDWCVKAVHSRGQWPELRKLTGVITTATLRSDGSLLNTPGYDPTTGLFLYGNNCSQLVNPNPTRDEAKAALDQVLDLVRDFPFWSAEHRSAWVSFLLTVMLRETFQGPAPLFLIDANVRGSGKSLLCDIVSRIAFGVDAARFSNTDDDNEIRKRITAIVLADVPLVLLDNIVGGFGCQSLDAALTGTLWRDRLLGENKQVELPLRTIWTATGNNVQLQADAVRRVLPIRLESPEERPETRSGFHYPDLLGHISGSRDSLISACLTIGRAWFFANCPRSELPAWGSYSGWSSVIRQMMVWLDQPDPGLARIELVSQSDREAMALAGLLDGLEMIDPGCRGLTALQIEQTLLSRPSEFQVLYEAIATLCSKMDARHIGNKLAHLRGRVCGGRCIQSKSVRSGIKAWYVARTNITTPKAGLFAHEDGSGGSGDSVLPASLLE